MSLWESSLAIGVNYDEYGEMAIDDIEYELKYHPNKWAAIKYAAANRKRDHWGAPLISACHWEQYEPGYPGKYIAYDGDSIEI